MQFATSIVSVVIDELIAVVNSTTQRKSEGHEAADILTKQSPLLMPHLLSIKRPPTFFKLVAVMTLLSSLPATLQ